MTTTLIFDQKARIGAWVAEQVEQTADWGSFYAMGAEQDGEIVAGIVFNNFNGHNATCHIAVLRTGKHLVELMKHGAHYAFNHCKLDRLTGMVDASNPKALKLDRHIGFQDEFVMPKAAADGGDLHVLVLWPENFRYWKAR
jgi:RimJ/RimL family protein N-acetyltransferase